MPAEMTIPEASRAYNIHVQTIHRARKSGHIQARRVGEGRHATYYLDARSFADWLRTYHPRPRSEQPVSG